MAETDWGAQSGSFGAGSSPSSGADVKSRVQETASRVSQSAADAVESGRRAAADGMQSAADALRSATDRLPGGPAVREFANRTAEGLDRSVHYLRERHPKDMWTDIQEGAKARPLPFLVGALALGFVAGRMLRRG